jgi:DNA-binding CsgD family transcriptional regulator
MTPITLTKQQLAVLDAARRGLTVAQTAREMFLAVGTVKLHRSNILTALGANTIAHAVALSYESKTFEAENLVWEHCGRELRDLYCPHCGVHRNRVYGAELPGA